MQQTCKFCQSSFETEVNFCATCGTAFAKSKEEHDSKSLNLIIVFYVTFLVFAFASYLAYDAYSPNLLTEIIIESVFALLVVGFSVLDYKGILKLYKLPQLDWKLWIFTFAFPIFTAFTVSFSINYLNEVLFEGINVNYFEEYTFYDYPLFWAILFIAIMPPIFEELAFRGFLFNQLQKVASNRITIIATAFIFALVHFSFISLIWIFPFGIILGYIRAKYKTLWPGIIIHFIHNFIVLMIDYYDYQSTLELFQ